jgi:hypothetical protein
VQLRSYSTIISISHPASAGEPRYKGMSARTLEELEYHLRTREKLGSVASMHHHTVFVAI